MQIYAEVSAKINHIAQVGLVVNKTGVLIELDSSQAQLKLSVTKNILKVKKQLLEDKQREYQEIKTLFDSLVRSRKELELAQIDFNQAQYEYDAQNDRVQIAQLELKKYQITAPFKSKVLSVPNLRNTTNHFQPKVLMVIEKVQ